MSEPEMVPVAFYRAAVRVLENIARGDYRTLGTVNEDYQQFVDEIIGKIRDAQAEAATLTRDLASARATLAEARGVLSEAKCDLARIGKHREGCHDYDEDMGHKPREFSDDEEWDLVERYARERAEYYAARIDAIVEPAP